MKTTGFYTQSVYQAMIFPFFLQLSCNNNPKRFVASTLQMKWSMESKKCAQCHVVGKHELTLKCFSQRKEALVVFAPVCVPQSVFSIYHCECPLEFE